MRAATTWRAVVIATGLCLLCWPLDIAQARKPAHSLPAVGGAVWVDADRDGLRDSGERGATKIQLSLQRAAKRRGRLVYRTVARTASGKGGRWSFQPTKAGAYRIKVALPSGYDGFSPQRRGRARTFDSDVRPSNGLTPRAALERGGKAIRFDVGLLPAVAPGPSPDPAPPSPPPSASPPPPFQIGGLVWRDNGDGYRDSTETARLQSTVELWSADRSQRLASTTTDALGAWTLTVPGGIDYRVRRIGSDSYSELAPKDQGGDDTRDSDFNRGGSDKGYTDVIPAGTGSLNIDAAATTPAAIGNLVWRDTNQNGRQDAGEPGEPNVTLELWDFSKTELLDVTVTNASGVYRLDAPSGGQAYRVRALLPAGTAFVPKNAGLDDQLDSDVNPSGVDASYTDVILTAPNLISMQTVDVGLVSAP